MGQSRLRASLKKESRFKRLFPFELKFQKRPVCARRGIAKPESHKTSMSKLVKLPILPGVLGA
jgi:hypothetical protein